MNRTRFEELHARLSPGIVRARLDADGICKPKTELRGVVMRSSSGEGTCSSSPGVALANLETGEYTWLG